MDLYLVLRYDLLPAGHPTKVVDFAQKILPPIKIGASTYSSLGVDKLLQHQNLRDTEM